MGSPSVMPSLSRLSLLPALLCGVGVLVSCQREVPQPELPLPETVLIPERSALTLSIRTDPDALTSGMPLEMEDWRAQVREETGIDLENDIQSWVGETLTFAVVEPDLEPQTDEPMSGFLFAARTRSAKDSTAALEQIRDLQIQEDGAEFEERRQGSIRLLIESDAEIGEQMVLASFGEDYVAISNDLAVMEEAIATFQQQDSASALSQDPEFTSVLGDLWQPDSLLFVYLNPRTLFVDSDLAADFDLTMPSASLESLQGLRSMAIMTRWQPEGLLVRAQADVDPEGVWGSVAAETVPNKLIERLPGDALVVISGHAIAQNWARTLERVGDDPDALASLELMRQTVAGTTQLDLEQDLIAWMDGEAAAVLVPDPGGHPLLQGLGAMVVLQSSQKDRAVEALEQLDRKVESYSIGVEQAADQVVWRDPLLNQPLVTRSWLENYLLISSSDEARATFAGDGGTRLPQTEPFKSLYETLPQPNFGYVMVNWQGILQWVESIQPNAFESLDPEAREVVKRFTAIGITGYPLDADSYRTDILLTLPPTQGN